METIIRNGDEILYNKDTVDITFMDPIESYIRVKDNIMHIRVWGKTRIEDSGVGILIYKD
jgi:hypothetical protein